MQSSLVVLLPTTVLFGSLNDITSKIRSVALGDFNFITGILNPLVYTVLYGTIVAYMLHYEKVGWHQLTFFIGKTENSSLEIPLVQPERSRLSASRPLLYLLLAGGMDAFGSVGGFVAQQHLPQVFFQLMLQNMILFIVILSILLLGKKYTLNHYLGVFIVMVAGIIGISSLKDIGAGLNHKNMKYALVAVLSTLPTAVSFVFKEKIFTIYREGMLKREDLNVIVMGLFTGSIQMAFVPVLAPMMVTLGETSGQSLSVYMMDSFQCLAGYEPESRYSEESQCKYALTAYVVYILVNCLFNIGLITVTKYASSVLAGLCVRILLPLTALLLMWRGWPLLSSVESRGAANNLVSVVLSLLGTVLFRYADHCSARTLDKINSERRIQRRLSQLPHFWPLVSVED